MPDSVKTFVGIWVVLIIIGIGGVMLEGGRADAGEVAILIVGHAINGTLVAFCAHRRRWARTVLAILVALGAAMMLFTLPDQFAYSTGWALAAVAVNAAAVVATGLLFTRSASDWFAERPLVQRTPEERARSRRSGAIAGLVVAAVAVVGGAYWLWGAALTDWEPIRQTCLETGVADDRTLDRRVEACDRIIASDWFVGRDLAAVHMARAATLQTYDPPRSATADYQAATAADPDNLSAWRLLGEAQLASDYGRFSAVNAFRQALRLDPDNPELHGLYGHALVLTEHYDEAEDELQIAVAARPAESALLALLSEAQYWQEELEAAVASANAALADPDIASETMRAALVFRSESLLRLHRYDAAIASAADLEEHFPREVGGPVVRILAHCATGDADRAMQGIAEATTHPQLRPGDWRAALVDWGYVTPAEVSDTNGQVLEPPLTDVLRRWVDDGCPQPMFDLP
ncbi:MAG: tetratricopeptide repeat protein [Rhodospirillaceae bacterium]|nr:tetratricopeptide repeat protein [Rhodospirillaceae bacterium]